MGRRSGSQSEDMGFMNFCATPSSFHPLHSVASGQFLMQWPRLPSQQCACAVHVPGEWLLLGRSTRTIRSPISFAQFRVCAPSWRTVGLRSWTCGDGRTSHEYSCSDEAACLDVSPNLGCEQAANQVSRPHKTEAGPG